MADKIIQIADSFWNIRGSFKLGGLVDIGTQSSLVRLKSGNFVMLDSYTFNDKVRAEVMKLTNNGAKLEAILNLHPFHTIHVKNMAEMFPNAKLYGTARHINKAPTLNWESIHTDSMDMYELYKDDFIFSVPKGVELIPEDEKLHFSSVLVIHKETRTLHVDDTLTWLDLPLVGGLSFHPSLSKVLEEREGAADEFQRWANELIEQCQDVDHLCTAHGKTLKMESKDDLAIAVHIKQALDRVQKTLNKHRKKHG